MDADETTGKEIENDAVRPRCDMDAEELYAVHPKSDLDAEAFDEDAKMGKKEKMEQQQQKRYSKLMRSQYKMWRSEGLLKKEKYCQMRETTPERIQQTDKKLPQRQEKNEEARTDSKNTRRLQRDQEHSRHQIGEKKGYSSLR